MDPCVPGQGAPDPCDAFNDDPSMSFYTMADVRNSPTTRCYIVVLGKVYDLKDFQQHHHGGAGEIREHCRQDATSDFFEKSFHTLVQLGAIQQFQVGVITGSTADACSDNYDPNPDGTGFADGSGDEEDDEKDSEDADNGPRTDPTGTRTEPTETRTEPTALKTEPTALRTEHTAAEFTFEDNRGRERSCEWLEKQKKKLQKKFCKEDDVSSVCSVCETSSAATVLTSAATVSTDANIFIFKGNQRSCTWLANVSNKVRAKACRKASVKAACPAVC